MASWEWPCPDCGQRQFVRGERGANLCGSPCAACDEKRRAEQPPAEAPVRVRPEGS